MSMIEPELVNIQATRQLPKSESSTGNEVVAPISGHAVLAKIPGVVRMRKAAKSYLIFLGLAVAAIFVPILHFILVPGFLLLSIFMAINAYVDGVEIANIELKCEKCNSDITLPEKRADQYPFWVKCTHCQTEYRIEKTH